MSADEGFPTSIGKVAARSLDQAGITAFADLTRRTRQDLLAIHGVGPKAVRLLGEALARRGLAFAGEGTPPGDQGSSS